jgi:putative DNA primase/helicase
MFIIEGRQGSKKSSMLRAIGGKHYAELGIGHFDQKELAVAMQGNFLIELGELTQFKRADVLELKAWVTRTHDRLVRKYDREGSTLPRQCILVGTTNQETYLADVTGARRFFSIACGDINLDMVNNTKELLFAEAYARTMEHESYWDFPEQEAIRIQEERRTADSWENDVAEFVAAKNGLGVQVKEVAACLGISNDKLDMHTQLRIRSCLKALGYKTGTVRENGIQVRRWRKDENGKSPIHD